MPMTIDDPLPSSRFLLPQRATPRGEAMIRVTGTSRSAGRGGPPPSSVPSSISSSSLSPLAPPFTVDRSLTAAMNPSTLPPPPPASAAIASSHTYPSSTPSNSAYSSSAAVAPYFVPSGESVWSSPTAAASSRLGTRKSGFRSVEAAPYYPYYAPLPDSVDDPFDQLPDYKGYAGAYRTFDAEERRPARGSGVTSSWMDPSPNCKMSLPSQKGGTTESFSVYEDTFGSWHGAYDESSSTLGHVGSECSEWLDDRHLGVYVENNRVPADGFGAADLDATVWPNNGSSYIHSPETVSVVKECDTFIPNSYDRYISQLISCSRESMVHFPVAAPFPRQGYAHPSNGRNESLVSSSFAKEGNHGIKYLNLNKEYDNVGYVIGKQNELSIYENADGKGVHVKMAVSGNAKQINGETAGSSLLEKGLPSVNGSAIGQSTDYLQDVKSGLKIANLNNCKVSNSNISASMPDDSMQTSSEIPDHLNVAVDSPCWRGAPLSRRYPFDSDEIMPPLVVNVTSVGDDLVQGQMPIKIQSDFEQDDTSVCNEIGKDILSAIPTCLSPVSDMFSSDFKLQDVTGRGTNLVMVENAKGIQQPDIHEQISMLIEQVIGQQGIDDDVKQLGQAENCKAAFTVSSLVSEVQNTALGVNQTSYCPDKLSSSIPSASNDVMNLSSPDVVPSELETPLLSDAARKCRTQGKDEQVLVKAMLSLSEVLLCHYCNDTQVLEECDLKPMHKIIDNLEAFILRNKKGITGSNCCVPRVEETQPELTESNADKNDKKDSKDNKENKYFMRLGLNNEKPDNKVMKSLSAASFGESDGMAQAFAKNLKCGFIEREEDDSRMLLYKNLWIQTEAALCSLKHDVTFMKFEMQNFKHNLKVESHFSSDGLSEPKHVMETSGKTNTDEHDSHRCNEHEASICDAPISVEDSNGDNTGVELNHKQNILKAGGIDDSVMARFKILKDRQEKPDLSGTNGRQELNVSSSYEGRDKVRGLEELSSKLTHVNTIENGIPQPHNTSKRIGGSPKIKSMPDDKPLALDQRKGIGLYLHDIWPAGAQESHPSVADGSSIQPYNPKSLRNWQVSSGSDSTSEWEHVIKDEFIW